MPATALTITGPDGIVVVETALVFTEHLSQAVAVPGTNLTLTIDDTVPSSTQWLLSTAAVPTSDLSALVAALEVVGEENLNDLFGLSPVEPYLTWKNLWESHRPLPYRLGALLLAVAQRTLEARGT